MRNFENANFLKAMAIPLTSLLSTLTELICILVQASKVTHVRVCS